MSQLCFVFVFFISTSLYAGEAKERFPTRFEVTQDLFSYQTKVGFSEADFEMQSLSSGKKSVGLAVLYSLLLPGLGEYYADSYGSGKYFSIAEAALWISYISFDVYGNSLKNDARSFAAAHAGVNPSGKDDQFFVDVGNFVSTQEFNDKRLRDRSPERLYDSNAGFGWQWDSDASRALFKETRLSGENVLNNRKFVITAIVLNHVISAINAARLVISHNRDVSEQGSTLQFKADIMGGIVNPHGVLLTMSRSF